MLIFSALLIGVINPLVCILHCQIGSAEASPDTGVYFYLCHGRGELIPSQTLVSMPTSGIVHSPKVAPIFDSYLHTAAIVLSGLIVVHILGQAGWHRRRQIVVPPILPPPQFA